MSSISPAAAAIAAAPPLPPVASVADASHVPREIQVDFFDRPHPILAQTASLLGKRFQQWNLEMTSEARVRAGIEEHQNRFKLIARALSDPSYRDRTTLTPFLQNIKPMDSLGLPIAAHTVYENYSALVEIEKELTVIVDFFFRATQWAENAKYNLVPPLFHLRRAFAAHHFESSLQTRRVNNPYDRLQKKLEDGKNPKNIEDVIALLQEEIGCKSREVQKFFKATQTWLSLLSAAEVAHLLNIKLLARHLVDSLEFITHQHPELIDPIWEGLLISTDPQIQNQTMSIVASVENLTYGAGNVDKLVAQVMQLAVIRHASPIDSASVARAVKNILVPAPSSATTRPRCPLGVASRAVCIANIVYTQALILTMQPYMKALHGYPHAKELSRTILNIIAPYALPKMDFQLSEALRALTETGIAFAKTAKGPPLSEGQYLVILSALGIATVIGEKAMCDKLPPDDIHRGKGFVAKVIRGQVLPHIIQKALLWQSHLSKAPIAVNIMDELSMVTRGMMGFLPTLPIAKAVNIAVAPILLAMLTMIAVPKEQIAGEGFEPPAFGL